MAKRNEHNEFAVIGLGRFGTSVALTLVERGYTVLGIDSDMRVVQGLADEITQTVSLDATDEDALRSVDIQLYPTVIVSIGNDFESKLLATLALKSLGVQRVICIASNERERTVLLKLGADQVVMPEIDSGRNLALGLALPTLLGHLPLGRGYSIGEVQTPDSFVGRAVRDTDMRASFGLTLVAIRRGEDLMISPGADMVFARGDHLLVLGKIADVSRFAQTA
jgi:trk system potassium uptake protein TrkA